MEHSTKYPTVLLKADMGADVNLMNLTTFDTLIRDRTVLQPTSLRMEAYGKQHSSGSVGKVPCIPQMERQSLEAIVLCEQCKYIT